MHSAKYIQVILPLKLGWNPIYSVQEEVSEGDRLLVSLMGRQYCGVAYKLDVIPDIAPSRIRSVEKVLPIPPVTGEEIRLWEFLSSYYMCSIGEVYKCAYPGLKIKSELTAQRSRERSADGQARQSAALAASLEARLGRLETRIARRQEALELRKNSTRTSAGVSEKLAAELSALMQEAGLVREKLAALKEQAAADSAFAASVSSPVKRQARARAASVQQKPLFLHSTDRTERYVSEVRAQLSEGRSSLILVPEIALGDTMQERLKAEFGDRLRIFNSQYTPVRRRKVMDDVRDASLPEVILGTRSSLFLPFNKLGLVIVDEEQDPMYKQTDPAPRFNARDTAVVLAGIHGAKVILGSGCPSLETLENCLSGKYALEEGPLAPACVEIIDLSSERHKRGVRDLFSYKLIDAIRETRGTVRIIRCWEQQDVIAASLSELFPDRKIDILTAQEARLLREPAELTAILQADAFFSLTDFRADERALQTFSAFRTARMLIQTTRAQHPVFSILASAALPLQLLDERRSFDLPPFTREVQTIGPQPQSFFFPKDSALAARKQALLQSLPEDTVYDVDPIRN